MKKTLLISTEFYPPAFKAGGPVKSVKNFVDTLKSKHDIYIITSAKDLNQNANMNLESVNKWMNKNGTKIIYIDTIFPLIINLIKVFFKKKVFFCYTPSFFNIKYSLREAGCLP